MTIKALYEQYIEDSKKASQAARATYQQCHADFRDIFYGARELAILITQFPKS